MAALTPQQIAYYAYKAGFRGQALNTAVAIALAESGGNPVAYNPEAAAGTKPGNGSRGLWQIYGTAHPWANNPQVFDPLKNAQAAYRVYMEAGRSFRPWSTYNQGLANIKADFSRMKFDSMPSPNVRVQSPGINLRPTSQRPTSQGFAGVTTGSGSVIKESPLSFLEKTPLAIFLGGSDQKGRNIDDLSMYAAGIVLIVIGLIMIFVIGTTEAAADNPEITRAALKLATGV